MNPEVLLEECWVAHKEFFRAIDNQVFHIDLRIKAPLTAQILPQCKIIAHFLGSKLIDKDLVLGFDLFYQLEKLEILPHRI